MNEMIALGRFLRSIDLSDGAVHERAQQVCARILVRLAQEEKPLLTAYDLQTEDVRPIRIRVRVNGEIDESLTRYAFAVFDSPETALAAHYSKLIAVPARALLERILDGEADQILLFTGARKGWDVTIRGETLCNVWKEEN